jgi:phosphatidylinositol 4-kinase type 2
MIYLGPLELTRRQKYLVWDDEVEVTPENMAELMTSGPQSPLHQRVPSSASLPQVATGRRRSSSIGNGPSPPPLRRTSTEGNRPRPVPFAKSFTRVHPATTGVAVLEQMEHIDRVEAKLQRGPSERHGRQPDLEEAEEGDIGVPVTPRPIPSSSISPRSAQMHAPTSPRSGPSLPVVQEELVHLDDDEMQEQGEDEDDEVDLAALSKSTGHLETSPSAFHARWTSAGDGVGAPHPFDMLTPDSERPKTVIVERLEPVTQQPMFSWLTSF